MNLEDKFSNAARNIGKRLGKGLKKSGQRMLKSLLGKNTKDVGKKALIGIVVAFIVLFIFVTTAYEATGEAVGETKNVLDGRNATGYDENGNIVVEEYSYANAACLNYFYVLSRNKSTWQEYDDNGEIILIRPTDERAVKDYFHYDEVYILNSYLLYSITEALYDDGYVYPEAFLNPVAYNEDDYTLITLKGEDGDVNVTSKKRSLTDGSDLGVEIEGVSDYGIATVLSYEEKEKKRTLEYSYIGETSFGLYGEYVKSYDTPEFHSETISSETKDILTHAVTFAGDVTYEYESTHDKVTAASGTGTSESDNALAIYVGDETVTCYYALPSYGPQTSDRIKYSTSAEYLYYAYCLNGAYYLPQYPIITDDEDDEEEEEEIVLAPYENCKTTTYTYKKYKYRSSDSGIYESFVRNSNRETNDLGPQYLYDYLSIFSTYAPDVQRTYDTFHNFTSSASAGNAFLAVTNSSLSADGGYNGGRNSYTAQALESGKMIWDGLLQWGFSEDQAGAVLGNLYQESRFNPAIIQPNGVGHGIAQWSVDGRFVNLTSFANSKGIEWTDLETQIQFMCMEIDSANTYSYVPAKIWTTGSEYYKTFMDDSSSIEEKVEAFCNGWEIAGEPMMANRITYAHDMYELFAGSSIEYEIAIIEPSSGSDMVEGSGNTYLPSGGLNEVDRQAFYDFYHAVEEVEGETMSYQYYTRYLGTSDVDFIIDLTDALIEGTTLTAQSQKGDEIDIWEKGYLTNVKNRTSGGYTVYTADCDFLFPFVVSGNPSMSSVFGFRESFMTSNGNMSSSAHNGFDLPAATGTEILASTDGTVVFSGYSESYGNYVKIETTLEDGTKIATAYAHNSALNVSVGETVVQGQVIAYAGSTGNSTGPHLHFELYVNDVPYNAFLTCWGRTNNIPAINQNGEQISVNVTPLSGWDYTIFRTSENSYLTQDGVVYKQ